MKPLVRPTVRCLATAMAALFAVSAAASSQAPPFRNPDLPAEQRLTNLLSLMTPDEKLQALGGFGSGVPRLGVPGFGSSEGIHGLVQRGRPERGVPPITTTQFPQPPGMGSTWNPDLVRRAGGVQGAEARYITQSGKSMFPMLMVWGPQADLARDPRWGRAEEVYGEDPFFNGVMATAFARGIQGNDPKYWQAAPLLKHFLANSNENGRMSSNSEFDERLFWEYYSVPFRMAFQDAGANAVMASYNAWNGTPMHLHPVLRDVLIGQWGVQVISSDGGGVQNLWEDHKVVPDQKAAVVAALKAGINQYLDKALEGLTAALKEGLVTEADLDEALRRKFRVSLKLGLLDPPEIVPYAKPHDGPAPWASQEHLAISKSMALESIVLLKNEATGKIVPSPAKGQPFEMQADSVRVIGWVDDPDTYPIQPKPHTLEFLREVAHLRPRTNVIGALTRVRHTIAKSIHGFSTSKASAGSTRRSSRRRMPRARARCSASPRSTSPTCRARRRARSISRRISSGARRSSPFPASSMSRPIALRCPRSTRSGRRSGPRTRTRAATWPSSG